MSYTLDPSRLLAARHAYKDFQRAIDYTRGKLRQNFATFAETAKKGGEKTDAELTLKYVKTIEHSFQLYDLYRAASGDLTKEDTTGLPHAKDLKDLQIRFTRDHLDDWEGYDPDLKEELSRYMTEQCTIRDRIASETAGDGHILKERLLKQAEEMHALHHSNRQRQTDEWTDETLSEMAKLIGDLGLRSQRLRNYLEEKDSFKQGTLSTSTG